VDGSQVEIDGGLKTYVNKDEEHEVDIGNAKTLMIVNEDGPNITN